MQPRLRGVGSSCRLQPVLAGSLKAALPQQSLPRIHSSVDQADRHLDAPHNSGGKPYLIRKLTEINTAGVAVATGLVWKRIVSTIPSAPMVL